MLRRLAAATTAGLMLAGTILPAAPPPPHPALARGLALMREGDFEAAVLELDAAARTMEADPAAERHRPWAYVYLGVAYLELEQDLVARGKFREALARDKHLRLLPAEFSAQSIRVFEDVRAEAAAAAAVPALPRPRPSATPAEGKKGSKGPLVAVLVGGAAAAGAAVALAGGGDSGGGTTTLAGGSTTLPAPVPSPSPSEAPPVTTPPTAPPTTQPPATQPPVTQPPATQPPTPTPPPSCSYDISGVVPVAATGCIGCTCSVTAAPSSCGWNARASDTGMITITRGSGTGDGNVVFNVSPSLSPRTGRITLVEGGGTCTVSQGTLLAPAAAGDWSALFAVERATGQITVNGSGATYQEPGVVALSSPPGPVRVEALVVTAAGRPGTWSFRLPADAGPASLRVVAGDVASIAAGTISFRLAGRPGERVVFTFERP